MQQQEEAIKPAPEPDAPAQRGPFPWTRMIIMLAISVILIALSLAIWISGGLVLNWGTIAPLVIGLILALIPFVQWLFPLSPVAWPARETNADADTSTQPDQQSVPTNLFHFDEIQLPSPAEFFGREYERSTLLARIAARSSTAIVGDYRIGKSWLIQYLIQSVPAHPQLGQRVHIGRLSATHPQSQTLAGFVKRALEVLNVPEYRASSRETPLQHLANAVRNLKALGIIPVLCIDEFAGLIGKPDFGKDFITGLRAIAEDDGLVLITASRHPLYEIIHHLTGDTSPLFNIMQELPLKGFNEQEARHFVAYKGRLAGFHQDELRLFLNSAAMLQPDGSQSWPPLRLQLVGQLLLSEKQRTTGQPAYDPKDPVYQRVFKQRVDEAYLAVVNQP
jgi:hypothetical protein